MGVGGWGGVCDHLNIWWFPLQFLESKINKNLSLFFFLSPKTVKLPETVKLSYVYGAKQNLEAFHITMGVGGGGGGE